jgi:hypothetical protein
MGMDQERTKTKLVGEDFLVNTGLAHVELFLVLVALFFFLSVPIRVIRGEKCGSGAVTDFERHSPYLPSARVVCVLE